jgi:AraC-like DNA-binding protein
MTSPQGGFARLSTDQFPEQDRVEATRELFGRAILKLDFEPLPDIPFHIGVTLRGLPGLALASVTSSALNCVRTPTHVDNDDLVIVVALSGSGTYYVRGRETEINASTSVLISGEDIGRLHVHSSTRLLNVRVPRNEMAPLIGGLGTTLPRPVPVSQALRLMVSYAGALPPDDALVTPEARNLVVTHFHDLAALAIGATRDAASAAGRRGLHAARLAVIKADILENFACPDLSVVIVAARHGVTPRYVHALFEAEPMTFSEFVLANRLKRAHRMLNDPRFAERSIKSVAAQAGFGDLTHFNRSFRRHYGATPSTVRNSASALGSE